VSPIFFCFLFFFFFFFYFFLIFFVLLFFFFFFFCLFFFVFFFVWRWFSVQIPRLKKLYVRPSHWLGRGCSRLGPAPFPVPNEEHGGGVLATKRPMKEPMQRTTFAVDTHERVNLRGAECCIP